METSPLEIAIKKNEFIKAISIVADSTDPKTTALEALELSARHGQAAIFSHLLTKWPDLQSHLQDDSILYSALDGADVPVWKVILDHEPSAKEHRFGHHGNIVEHCVKNGDLELLRFLLEQGASVEQTDRSILQRAEVCGASEEMKALLIRYGATRESN